MKKTLSLILSIAMCFALAVPVMAADDLGYTDIPATAQYAKDVAFCLEEGIFNDAFGKTGEFKPEQALTRAEFVSILFNAYMKTQYIGEQKALEVGKDYLHPDLEKLIGRSFEDYLDERVEFYKTQELKFADVSEDAYYALAVKWASHINVSGSAFVNGTSATTFSPDDIITREQMMTILHRFATLCGIDFYLDVVYSLTDDPAAEVAAAATKFGYTSTRKVVSADASYLNAFTDGAKVSGYAKEAVSWAVQAGYVNGTSATTLSPQGTTTRAQVATLFARMYNDLTIAGALGNEIC